MRSADSTGPLRLAAANAGDLAIISALLQDAIVLREDMRLQDSGFIMAANRYRHEDTSRHSRTNSLVEFRGVSSSTADNLTAAGQRGFLMLLAIQSEPDGKGVRIELRFAGNGLISLESPTVDCRLTDTGSPWSAAAGRH